MGELPGPGVQAAGQAGVGRQGGIDTERGELADVREGRVDEGAGGGVRYGAGQVGDAVVDDALDLVGRVVLGGGPGGLEAASLVDGHVDRQRVQLQSSQVVAGDELGGRGAGNEDGADDDVGGGDLVEKGGRVGLQDPGGAAEQVLQLAERAVGRCRGW